jgi:hypothetical protein
VEEQDVHDHRAEERKTERNIASDQEQQTADDLQQADDVNVMALHERFAEVSGQRRGQWRHRDEVQKDVRAEDDEHESQQDAGDDGGDFHGVMLNATGAISIAKGGESIAIHGFPIASGKERSKQNKYAAEQGMNEGEALNKGMEAKSKEFVENGA